MFLVFLADGGYKRPLKSALVQFRYAAASGHWCMKGGQGRLLTLIRASAFGSTEGSKCETVTVFVGV